MGMGGLSKKSFDVFLESLKRAGVAIYNENELRERLAEARHWQYAFATLASNGRALGIRFEDARNSVDEEGIRRAFCQFHFPESIETSFAASLRVV